MAHFSDGYNDSHVIESQESSSPIAAPANVNLRIQLQALLDDKEKQLKLAGTLGQRVLAQQVELEERITQLNDLEAAKTTASDEEYVETEIREKLRDLRDTMNSWESENQGFFDVLGNKVNDVPPSPPAGTLPTLDVKDTSALASPSSGPSAAQSSRRAKNAAHRAHDVEFAFEIGSSLLTEVRRLQSLIAERDKALQDLNEENQDLRSAVEDLKSGLETHKSTAEKYKEENWNLEVAQQELRTNFQSSQKDLEASELERKRTARELLKAKDSIDQHKNEAERLTTTLSEFKAKHETDVAQMRKQAAGLQRDKSDLQSAMEALKSDIAKKDRSIKRFGSPLTPNGLSPYTPVPGADGDEDEDVFVGTGGASRRKLDVSVVFGDGLASDFADSSPDPSPSRPHLAPNHPSNEIEVLKQSLAHAQRQVNMLRGTVQREKELRMEYRRKLADAEGKMGMVDDDDEDENIDPVNVKPRPPRVSRGRGRGLGLLSRGSIRGGARSKLSQRMALAPGTPDSDFLDNIDETTVPDHTGEGPTIMFEDEEPEAATATVLATYDVAEDEDEDDDHHSPSPSHDRADGMDPAFANVLRRASPSPSPLHGSSPLRGVSSAGAGAGPVRGGRRTRGGAPRVVDSRPSSVVEPAGALAAELGLGMAEEEVLALGPELTFTRHVETAEMACQTDPEPAPVPPVLVSVITPEPPAVVIVPPPPPPVETREIAVQAEEVIVRVETSEVALQVEPLYSHAAIETVGVRTSEAEMQTPQRRTVEMEIQTLPIEAPTPLAVITNLATSSAVQHDHISLNEQSRPSPSPIIPIKISTTFSGSGVTRRGTVVGHGTAGLRTIKTVVETDDDGEATEMEAEPETETDTGTETEGEYTDAHEFPSAVTPVSGSVSDFHSAKSAVDTASLRNGTGVGNGVGPHESTSDFYSIRSVPLESDADDSDQESIKASRMARSRTMSRMTGASIGLGYAGHEMTPTSKVVVPMPPPPREMFEEGVQVEEMKPEVADGSMQTDEWIPPAPTPPPPAPAPAYGLFRVGAHTQQFQYIPPISAPSSPGHPSSHANTNVSRDSSASTIVVAPRRTSSLANRENDRRPSIEAALAINEDILRARTQSTQSLLPPPDKTRPPTMMLPPPPRMPPPPPDKKFSTASSRDMPPPRDIPPPRPTSPPPPELIQRATTPTFGNQALLVPSRSQHPHQQHHNPNYSIRQHGSSMPPSQSHHGLGHRPSTNSFRSAANAAAYATVSGASGISTLEAARRQQSTTSLVSSRPSSMASRRSSLSSDQHHVPEHQHMRPPAQSQAPPRPGPGPMTPGRVIQGADGSMTDPAIIHAITQTMIGEFLYKYTRKVVGKGHGEKRHKRFFWVHPYTKTLYWSSADPGSSNVSESSAKSAYIDSVRSVLDPNPLPPGLHQYSVIVSTPQREMKFTAPTKERHDIWFNALNYLLTRPSNAPGASPQAARIAGGPASGPTYGSMRLPADESMRRDILASPRSARSIGSALSGDSWNITPRAQRSQSRLSTNGSVGKRSGTPAAEYLRLGGPDGPASPSKSDYEYVPGRVDDEELDFEIHDSIVNGEGYEGLENVRACCDGRHDLGTLSRKPHHHHHHHTHHHPPHPNAAPQNQNPDTEDPVSRPVSPSAWSFRSRAGSTASKGGDAASIWSRFGSKRSKGAPPVPASPGGPSHATH